MFFGQSLFFLIALSYPGSIKFVYNLAESPPDRKTTMHRNALLITFHAQNISPHAWKIVRTTMQSIVILQSRGEGPEK